MKNNYAFISYQTVQKQDAGRVKELLANIEIDAFLAHEDINVSQEWRIRILEELRKASIFICLLSKEYFESIWCVQESGIAAFRKNMTIIPISLDGEIPKGFISQYQSANLTPGHVGYKAILPGIIRHSFSFGTDKSIHLLSKSQSFREAEYNFEIIFPYVDNLTEEQVKRLMISISSNAQIHSANLCIKKYIPPLLDKFSSFLPANEVKYLKDICERYRT